MKILPRRLFPVLCAALLGAFLPAASSRADTLLMLNFSLGNAATNVPANNRTISGYDNVCAPFVGTSVNANIGNIDGTGISFTIDNVSSYDTGHDNEPLTTSGFYTFGNDTNDHTFTLTGLPAGSTVTLYAVSAWDGNGRGGVINFGTGTTQAQVIGDAGTAPTLANFTQINTTPVTATGGMVTGNLYGAGGAGSGTEGQVGAFIFDVATPAPEPSTFVLMGLGGVALVGYRTRRK